tara:strand:- start:282 stop:428 length:147 start_codon:yes stop_codon:yes gene_type:complete
MNPLQRALVEKPGHDNGLERVMHGTSDCAALTSARIGTRVDGRGQGDA